MKLPDNAALIVRVLSFSSVATVNVVYFTLTKTGQIQQNSFQIQASLTTGDLQQAVPLQAVELLSYSVSQTSGLPGGQNIAIVSLGEYSQNTFSPVVTLSTGVVDAVGTHSWADGATLLSPEVQFPSFVYQIPNPGAGNDAVLSLPNTDGRVDAIRFSYTCDATVATRTVYASQDSIILSTLLLNPLSPTLAASASGVFQLANCGVDRSLASNLQIAGMGPLHIRRQERLTISAINKQAGDTITNIQVQLALLPPSY
jgi:hypothetical protein